MKRFIINGKFLAQPITGVQRVAREILPELDLIVDVNEVELVVPADAKDVPKLKKIRIVRSKYKKSIIWEQLWLPLYILKHKAIGVHLCHVAPIIKPDIVCIHDANVLRNPQWFTRKVVLWYRIIDWCCARFSKKILTDSCFSKSELLSFFKIDDDKIAVLNFGWQHFCKIVIDDAALKRYALKKNCFYFSLGTRAPHKNIDWIYGYARMHPETTFAVSGSSNGRIFGKVDPKFPPNVIFLGYLSDGEIKTLMQNCKAFVFPSFYEGFGLPPLEALCTGATVIASDIPVMREIFGDAVHYIDPKNIDVDLDKILVRPLDSTEVVLDRYGWDKGARIIYNIFREFS